MNSENMLSVDLSFPSFFAYGVDAVVTYDWVFPIKSWKEAGSWNWYAGVGGGVGLAWSGYFNIGIAGRIGVEYMFENRPLQLSVDYAPVIGPYFGNGVGFNSVGLSTGGIAARYCF